MLSRQRPRRTALPRIGLTALLALGARPILPAQAAPSFGLVPAFPTTQTIGQPPIGATLWMANSEPAPVTVAALQFIPSCSNWDLSCSGGIADPGTFTVSSTGTGERYTACAGQTFNLAVADAATGRMRVSRTDGQNVVLTAQDISSDRDICKINLTMKANRFPNHDAHPNLGGVQTNQNMAITGVTGGVSSTVTNHDVTTVKPGASRATADFNGDGRSDVGLYRQTTGTWHVKDNLTLLWGGDRSDIPVSADYDKDGVANPAVYRRAVGMWWIRGFDPVLWGGDPSDVPVAADYNKDGKPEVAVYRKATGIWFINGMAPVYWGGEPSDVSVPADYDGDGDADIAVYRASSGMWYIQGMAPVYWGGDPTDVPAPADYDGDADVDIAVYRASSGIWYIQGMAPVYWGGDPTDVPVPGNYDGDGDVDVAVYRRGTGVWWIRDMAPIVWGGDPSDSPVTGVVSGL